MSMIGIEVVEQARILTSDRSPWHWRKNNQKDCI